MLSLDECREIRAAYDAGATYAQLRLDGLGHTTARRALTRAGGCSRPAHEPFRGVDLERARTLARQVTARRLTVKAFSAELDVSLPTGRKLIRFTGGRTPRESR